MCSPILCTFSLICLSAAFSHCLLYKTKYCNRNGRFTNAQSMFVLFSLDAGAPSLVLPGIIVTSPIVLENGAALSGADGAETREGGRDWNGEGIYTACYTPIDGQTQDKTHKTETKSLSKSKWNVWSDKNRLFLWLSVRCSEINERKKEKNKYIRKIIPGNKLAVAINFVNDKNKSFLRADQSTLLICF